MAERSLADPRLLAIDSHLDEGELNTAQALLAELGDSGELVYETSYLTTRLLFLKGWLSADQVVERLQELLEAASHFPEAEALVKAVQGTIRRLSSAPTGAAAASDEGSEATASGDPSYLAGLEIPRAPNVPHFVPVAGRDSDRDRDDDRDTDLELTEPSRQDPDPVSAPAGTPMGAFGHHSSMPTLASPPPVEVSESPAEDTDPMSQPASSETIRARSTGSGSLRRPGPGEQPSSERGSVLDRARSWISKERYTEALLLLEQATDGDSAELSLLHAQALFGVGAHARALEQLSRVSEAPLVDPELRAQCAGLWLRADRVQSALEQAQIALDVDPDSPQVRLALCWAKVRSLRHGLEDATESSAEDLLRGLEPHQVQAPELLLGVRACVLVEEGDARAGLETAERALALSPGAVEALAAACSACAAMARFRDAQGYWLRLFRADYEEAHALRERLGAADILLRDESGSIPPSSSESGAQDLWDPLEVALTRGERTALLSEWEKRTRHASEALGYSPSASNIFKSSEAAARCLSSAPGLTHFGPFDFSLYSLARLEVALDLVYGPVPTLAASDRAVWLVAAYVGETLRHAYRGAWHLDDTAPYDGKIVTRKGQFSVFRNVEKRLRLGSPLGIDEFIERDSNKAGPEWKALRELQLQVPTPWGNGRWPSVAEVERLGRAMPYSVVSLYCKHYGGAPLDGTLSTLSALNRYLLLVSPPAAPVRELDPLLTRTGIFIGSYVGEVLRKSLGGFWQKPSTPPLMKDSDLGAPDYVVMAGRVATRPIATVLERLSGASQQPILEYVLSVRDQG